jgi:phospholipid/cholesterol/gamma-HCH transport system substrate-binding protein
MQAYCALGPGSPTDVRGSSNAPFGGKPVVAPPGGSSTTPTPAPQNPAAPTPSALQRALMPDPTLAGRSVNSPFPVPALSLTG